MCNYMVHSLYYSMTSCRKSYNTGQVLIKLVESGIDSFKKCYKVIIKCYKCCSWPNIRCYFQHIAKPKQCYGNHATMRVNFAENSVYYLGYDNL